MNNNSNTTPALEPTDKRTAQEFSPRVIREHTLEQRGTDVICTSCAIKHGQTIGVDEMIVAKEGGGLKVVKINEWNS